jgi:thiol-disulfide isomerase/thioredoxin
MRLRPWRWFWMCAVCVGMPSAWAQFEKTPGPNSHKTPPLVFRDVTGQVFDVPQMRGKKIILNVWATWCAPCKEELPNLQVFSDLQDPDKVVVLTLNVKEPPSRAQTFMRSQQIKLPLISDPQGEWAHKLGIKVYPSTLLIDSQGQIKWRIVGEVDWTAVEPQTWVNSLR